MAECNVPCRNLALARDHEELSQVRRGKEQEEKDRQDHEHLHQGLPFVPWGSLLLNTAFLRA